MLNIFKKKKTKNNIVKMTVNSNNSVIATRHDKLEDKMIDNNIKGKELEKKGKVEEAIKFYEYNISKNFEGNGPYDRLAIIYRKKKDYENEIRVLNHAIEVFTKLSKTSPRGDVKPKLTKFKERLSKTKALKSE